MVDLAIDVDQQNKFNKDIKRIIKGVEDIRPALNQVKKQWYQGNKSIFTLSSEGQYEPLSDKYEKWKQKNIGFVYPLLKAKNRRIEKAITDPKNDNAYSKINKTSIILGVEKSDDLPYALSIHYGYAPRNIPARPYVLLGIEQVATPEIKKKPKVYLDLIKDHILEISQK